MNKKIKMAAGAGLAALAIAVAGGGYYFFHVRADTPAYAIETLTKAIENHDVQEFHRVVNVDGVIDSGYDGFVEGITATSDNIATPEAADAIRSFTKMLRGPLTLSMKTALDSYIATGDFKADDNSGVLELLERTGLHDADVRDVKNIQVNDANPNEAFADVIVYQPELEREFPIQIILTRGKDDRWKIDRVQNFQNYVAEINKARRKQLDDYLLQSVEINSRHDAILRDAEKKYGMILSAGSLGQDKTRADLKNMLDEVFRKDWEARKQEFFSMHVPKDAETLHNLYLRICDLAISAAQDYAKWMDDKNAPTIKSAEDKIHQVQTLMTEASALAKRMTTTQQNNSQ